MFNKTPIAHDLIDAVQLAIACGHPERVSLYDEEGIEGWMWTSPTGREWTAIGDWDDDPPLHPVLVDEIRKVSAALSSAGEAQYLRSLLQRLMSEVRPYCRPSMVHYDVFPVFLEAVNHLKAPQITVDD